MTRHTFSLSIMIGLCCCVGISSAHAAQTITATGSVVKSAAKPSPSTEGVISAVTLKPLPPTAPSLTLTTSNGDVTILLDTQHTKVWAHGAPATIEQLIPGTHVQVIHAVNAGADTASRITILPAASTPAATASPSKATY